jgi:hypothetical protein
VGFLRKFIQKRGGFPAPLRSELDGERLVLLAEAVPASISAPRKLPTLAAIALTQQRLVVWAGGESLLDVDWDSGDARKLEVGAPDDGLRIAFEGADFGHREGRVELLLKVGAQATPIMAAIEQRRRELPPRRRLADREDEDAD